MKTRNGFVSNSSSSSFVVRRCFGISEGIVATTSDQNKLLEKYGFRKTFAHAPEQVPAFHDEKEWKKEAKFLKDKDFKDRYNYGYEVVCNQDEVIEFLVKNRISFVASCHYGHETVVYDSKTNVLYFGENYGRQMECYGVDSLEKMLIPKSPVTKILGDVWLKKNSY